MIRKYYDVLPAEGGEVIEKQEPQGPINVAEYMAKNGTRSSGLVGVTPASLSENLEEGSKIQDEGGSQNDAPEVELGILPTTEQPKINDAPEVETDENGKPKSELPSQPEIQQPSVQPIVAEAPKVPTLTEVLKTAQPEAVFRELGLSDDVISFVKELKSLDPKMVGMVNTYKTKGVDGIKEYLSVMATDYQAMPAEDVMREVLKKEYPQASKEELDVLYKVEVVEKYKLDEDRYTEEEVQRGKLLLKAKSDKYRSDLISEQEKNLIPPPPAQTAHELPDETELALQQKQYAESIQKLVLEDQVTQQFIANKAFTVGSGDSKFTYPVSPNEVLADFWDADKINAMLWNVEKAADGSEKVTPKTSHQLLCATVFKHGYDYLDKFAKHYYALGQKSLATSLANAQPKAPVGASGPAQSGEPKTPEAAMAKFGKLIR